jgi:hypothetical protein
MRFPNPLLCVIVTFVTGCAPQSQPANLSPVAEAALKAQLQCARGAVAREGYDIRLSGPDSRAFSANRTDTFRRTVEILMVNVGVYSDTAKIQVTPSSGNLVADERGYVTAPTSASAKEAAHRVEAECRPQPIH